MSLDPGRKLGSYEILAPIGAGGMGEVYKARDTKLGREVAIKVLPEAFARDKERLARFEREARILASLNHPNIATLFDLQESDGMHFLVLELVPGETLAERIKSGAILIDEALPFFKQIAEALEAAHEKGIIHRDLKPANIKVTPEGKIKVLDFGLAKALAGEATDQDLSESPTFTRGGTETGVLLGTAPYMSPEQARGKSVDKRTDIWAFGCCLYEALCGKAAFLGETVSDTIAGILKQEPDWQALPKETPALVRSLLRRSLAKDPSHRLQHIGDARIEIEEALAGPRESEEVSAAPKKQAAVFLPSGLIGLIMGAAVASMIVWYTVQPSQLPSRDITRFAIDVPTELVQDRYSPSLSISPDGKQIVFVATSGNGMQLFLRTTDRLDAAPIPGTDGAAAPFFSPDGQWVGFFAEGKLKKAPLRGGAPVTLCDTEGFDDGAGLKGDNASWGIDDNIIVPGIRCLMRVSAGGGTPEAITEIPAKRGELTYSSPHYLPGGKSVLFHIATGSGFENMKVAAHALGTEERRILVEGGSQPQYASSGHLIYALGGTLMAAPFDADRLEVTGPPVPVLHGVAYSPQGRADFSVSLDGSLVYAPAEETPEITVLWMDRQGGAQPIELPPHEYFVPSLSPDGRRLALTTIDGPRMETWIFDIERNVLTRFTFEGSNHFSVWTPDGERLAFSSDREGPHNIYWKPADGSGTAERLVVSDQHQDVGSWSPDGKILAFSEAGPGTNWDIFLVHVDGERRVEPFLQTDFVEDHPMISPDGRWIAYRSNESGRYEIYVQPFPDGGRKLQISTAGGSDPRWARDGRELFYREDEIMMVVGVETGDEFSAERPRMLFASDTMVGGGHGGPNFDITPDGRRFVMVREKPQPPPTEIHVILNWFEELKRLVPSQ